MYDLNCKNNRKGAGGRLFAPIIFSLCIFMRQKRSIFRGKGPKIRARKIGGQKLYSAVNHLLSL